MAKSEAGPDLLTLREAAARLSCHIETLRRRVRSGALGSVRGRRGAHLVSASDLTDVVVRRGRPLWLPTPLPPDRLDLTWPLLREVLAELGARAELEFLDAIHRDPELDLPAYRLVTAHRLRLAGFVLNDIAAQLSISVRHASRLAQTPPVPGLRRRMIARLRLAIREHEDRHAEAMEAALERVRLELGRRGVRPSAITKAQLSRRRRTLPPTAFARSRPITVTPQGPHQLQALRDAGLSEEQVDAVATLGLTPDELNALLLRGFGPRRESPPRGPRLQKGVRRSKSR